MGLLLSVPDHADDSAGDGLLVSALVLVGDGGTLQHPAYMSFIDVAHAVDQRIHLLR